MKTRNWSEWKVKSRSGLGEIYVCFFLWGPKIFLLGNRRRAKQEDSGGLDRREGQPLNSTGDNNIIIIASCELKLFTDIRPLSPAFFTVLLLGYTRWPPGSLTPLPRRGSRSLVNMVIVKLSRGQ